MDPSLIISAFPVLTKVAYQILALQGSKLATKKRQDIALKEALIDDYDEDISLKFIREKEELEKKLKMERDAESNEEESDDAMISYNHGCYACQLGDMDNAKKFVGDAIKLDSKYKLMALDDEDLEPLWDSLASL